MKYGPRDAKHLLEQMGEENFVNHLLERFNIRESKPVERSVHPTKASVGRQIRTWADAATLEECHQQSTSSFPVVLAHPRMLKAQHAVHANEVKVFSEAEIATRTRKMTERPNGNVVLTARQTAAEENKQWKQQRTPRKLTQLTV